MNLPLVIAGSLALLAAIIHGAAGELLVVRRLSPAALPPSRFGGPRTTRKMIHVTWHLTTVAFLTVALALLLSGTVVHGDAARGIAVMAASGSTGFAALTVAMGGAGSPRALLRHPAALVLTATAVLAWVGAT
jgi:hypothetical protein